MIGVKFVDIGEQNKSLSTVFSLDDSFRGYDDDYKFYTTMQVWNGNGYDFYGWAGTGGSDVDSEPELDNTWTDLDAYAVEKDLASSDAVWVNAEKAGVLTVSGQIITTNVTVNLTAGYNMVANPYPIPISVSNFGRLDSSYKGYDDDYKFYTTMQVWNGNGYDFYGWAGTGGSDVDSEPELDNTWTDLDAYAVNAVIPAYGAAWVNAEKAGTISFTFPE